MTNPNMFFLLGSLCLLIVTRINALTTPLTEYIEVPGKYIAPIPSDSLQVERGISLQLCAAKCTLEFRMKSFPCYAFEYTPGSQMCVHTNVTSLVVNGGYLGLKSNAAVNYYERTKVSYSNLFHGIPNTALKEESYYYDIKFNTTLEECAFDCLSSSSVTCMSFSHSEANGACGLSRAMYQAGSNSVSLQSSSIYNHYQFFTRWPCNVTIKENYNPKVVASLRYPYHSIRHSDCYAKIEAPQGQRVHLTFPVLFFERNNCDATMSGVNVYDGDSESSKVIGRYCHTPESKGNPPEVISSGRYVYIHYKTDDVAMAFESLYDFVTIDPCKDQPCQNGATCLPDAENINFTCACAVGFTGERCEVDIDECAQSPCYFEGTCVDRVGGFTCQCHEEFRGERCQQFVGKCGSNPCIHGSCAITSRYNYSCTCEQGYTGRNCDISATPCSLNPCVHGNCLDVGENYLCRCEKGYKGLHCDVIDFCALDPCVHGNCSMTSTSSVVCSCERGFTGKYCDQMVDMCANKSCHFGICDPNDGRCICNSGVRGVTCDDVTNICSATDCGQGQCFPYPGVPDGYVCYCDDRQYRKYCNYSTDACAQSPCLHGTCVNRGGNFTCMCDTAFKGAHCDVAVPCSEADCGAGLCLDSNEGFQCICPIGYTGTNCQDITTSTTPSVQTKGPCSLNCNQGKCIVDNTDGHMTCVCPSDWSGNRCQHYTYTLSQTGDCQQNSCPKNARCLEMHPGYACACDVGTSGYGCFDSGHPCSTSPCRIDQTCIYTMAEGVRCLMNTVQGSSNTSISINNTSIDIFSSK